MWVSLSVLCLLLDNEMERRGWTESLHCLHCAMLRTVSRVTKVLGSVELIKQTIVEAVMKPGECGSEGKG